MLRGASFGVANKYLYHVPGMPETLSNLNYLVVAEKVHGNNGKGQALNLKQTQQLYKLAILANHYDLHCANYRTTSEGKVIIIDTDKEAMPAIEVVKEHKKDWLLHGNRLHEGGGIRMNPDIINDPLIKLELQMYSKWDNYDDEAYRWLASKLKEREAKRTRIVIKLLSQLKSVNTDEDQLDE